MKRVFVYEHLSAGSAGSPGPDPANLRFWAQGRAMRDAIAVDLLALEDYAVSVARGDPASPVPAGATAVQARCGESGVDFVAREADSHELVWAVAPETDGLLGQLQRRVDPARWLGCDAHAIALSASKRRTSAHLAEAGVATPLAFAHDAQTIRWIVKPDAGAGAVAARVHADLDGARVDLAARSRDGVDAVLESWVEGHALSLSLLCSATGTELLSVNRQHLEVGAGGALHYHGVASNVWPVAGIRGMALQALARSVWALLPGLRGFVGIDIVWHAHRGPVVIEVNPRVTCAYVGLSRSLKRNLAADVIAAFHPGGQREP